jgi:hypothetical protein
MIKFITINNTHVLRVLYETNSPHKYYGGYSDVKVDRIVEYKGDILFYTDTILKNKDELEIELKRLRDNKFLSRNPELKKKLIIYYEDVMSKMVLFERDEKIYDLLDRDNHLNSLILAC